MLEIIIPAVLLAFAGAGGAFIGYSFGFSAGKESGHKGGIAEGATKARRAIESAEEALTVAISTHALERAKHIRGAPKKPLGITLSITNTAVASSEIEQGARYAACAIAYAQSAPLALMQESPEMRGLRFALWWHGMENDREGVPFTELDKYWDHARTAPVLRTLATIDQAFEARESKHHETLEDETIERR